MIIQTDASKTGWGAVCQGEKTRGVWSEQEQKLHINILELLAVKLTLLSFTKSSEQYSLPNRQHDSNKILDKNGRDEKCETGEPEQRDLGISFRSWDHNYHRIPSECNEYDSRSGVQGKDGPFRMDAMSKNFK